MGEGIPPTGPPDLPTTSPGEITGVTSVSPDYGAPVSWNLGDTSLSDGEQLIRKTAYYYLPNEDEYGFLSIAGFTQIRKDSVYQVGGIENMDSRKSYDPGTTDDFTSWQYGEEPIQYKDSVSTSTLEDTEWSEFKNFIHNNYQNLAFTSYRSTEHYLNWYDYSAAELILDYELKSDNAHWKQANQLRAINKLTPVGADEVDPDAGMWTIHIETYNINAEAPYIESESKEAEYTEIWTRLDDGFSAKQDPGFQHSSPITRPGFYEEDLRSRFKSYATVVSNVENYLGGLTEYVATTGYTTTLKRALTSEVQNVTRFTKREFTTMALSEPTLYISPGAASALGAEPVPPPPGIPTTEATPTMSSTMTAPYGMTGPFGPGDSY